MSSNHAVTDAENAFIKAEPVIAAHAGAAVVGYAGTLLVTHGVITHDQASALTQQVLPAVVAGLLVVLAVVVRRFVAPAALFAQRVEDEVQRRLEGVNSSPLAAIVGTGSIGAAGLQTIPGGGQVASEPVTATDPIQVTASDFLPAATEVPAAEAVQADAPSDAAVAGAHAADPLPAAV